MFRNISLSIYLMYQVDYLSTFYEAQLINQLSLRNFASAEKRSIGLFSIAIKMEEMSSQAYK